MFRTSLIAFIILACLSFSGQVVAGDEEYAYTIQTGPDMINIQNGTVFIEDGEVIAVPGAPRIGYRILRLALPPDKSFAGFSVETDDPVIVANAHLDYVVGDLKTGGYPPDTASGPDPAIFDSDEIYPRNQVEVLGHGAWGGINLVNLAVYPVRYKPLSGRILLFPEITVKLNLVPASRPFLASRTDMVALRAIDELIDNREDVPSILAGPPDGGLPTITSGIPSPQYLIIASGDIAPGFYQFLEWKNQKGIPTDLVLIEDILATIPGIDPQEQLRNYLIQAYNEGARWVLLGGDEDHVPIRYLYPGNVNNYYPDLGLQQISDLYYADLTGNWDADGDGVWGESYNDNPDIYPELYVGRVPARNSDQALAWSNKAILYEKNPGNGDPSYLTKALFICADQMRDYGQHYVLGDMMPSNFMVDVHRLEEMPSGGAPSPTGPYGYQVINIMNEGWGFISNLNHGSPEWYAPKSNSYNHYGWSAVWSTIVPEWGASGALIQLTAYNQPAVHYSISCDLGAYDFDKGILSPNPYATTFTFAEAYLFEPGAGVAFLGNSRWGWVTSSYNMEKKFIEHVFDDSTSRISEAEALSKIDCPNYRDIGYGHTFFGDPEMRMWKVIEGSLALGGPTYLDLGNQPVILVYTVSMDGNPVQGAEVCLYLPGDLFLTGISDEDGAAQFEIIPQYDGIMTATATKQNHIPDQLQVVLGSPAGTDDEIIVPRSPEIFQNYPNPFNSSTIISFELPEETTVDLDIYDIGGRLVKRLGTRLFPAGTNNISWDGSNGSSGEVSSGIYFYKFTAGEKVSVKQMTLLK
jgi:hypothetical protein